MTSWSESLIVASSIRRKARGSGAINFDTLAIAQRVVSLILAFDPKAESAPQQSNQFPADIFAGSLNALTMSRAAA